MSTSSVHHSVLYPRRVLRVDRFGLPPQSIMRVLRMASTTSVMSWIAISTRCSRRMSSALFLSLSYLSKVRPILPRESSGASGTSIQLADTYTPDRLQSPQHRPCHQYRVDRGQGSVRRWQRILCIQGRRTRIYRLALTRSREYSHPSHRDSAWSVSLPPLLPLLVCDSP